MDGVLTGALTKNTNMSGQYQMHPTPEKRD
jgi:hypothetical protein